MITCAKAHQRRHPHGAVLVQNHIYDDMMAAGKGPSSCSTATPTRVTRWRRRRVWRPWEIYRSEKPADRAADLAGYWERRPIPSRAAST